MFNYFRLVKYYICKKRCGFFESLQLAKYKDLYLFNLDLFEKSVLR